MGRRLIAVSALAVPLAFGAIQASSQGQSSPELRVLATTKNGELSAEIPKRADWCQPDLTFTIRGQEDIYFTGGELDEQGRQGRLSLQKLLGVIRVALQSECPQTRSITFNGFVDDVFVFRGYAERGGTQGDWVLAELPVGLVTPPEPPPPPVTTVAPPTPPAPRLEAVAECDALAAHPDDPKRPKGVPGVSEDDMKAGQAAEICEEAIAVQPDNPRLRYQLARAYLLFGKASDGVEMMTQAAEEGHAAAIASLGDFSLYGLLDDEPDPETAKALYLRAAKAGFKPAEKLAAAIQANPQEDKSQEVAPEPQYTRPELAQIVLAGDSISSSRQHYVTMAAYLNSFIGGIRHQCPNFSAGVGEEQYRQTMMRRMMSDGSGSTFLSLMVAGQGAYEGVQQEGMDDGYALAVSKGCSSKELSQAKTTLELSYR